MLGQPVPLALPQVVGCKLVGSINPLTTSIDIVLGITKVALPMLMKSPRQWFMAECYRIYVLRTSH